MSWKCFGSTFSMSLGMPSKLGDLPLDKFLRHVSNVILAKDGASGASGAC